MDFGTSICVAIAFPPDFSSQSHNGKSPSLILLSYLPSPLRSPKMQLTTYEKKKKWETSFLYLKINTQNLKNRSPVELLGG